MKYLKYKNDMYTAKELSEMSGIKYTTLLERLNRGYTVEEAMMDRPKIPPSVTEFVGASYPKDWDGLVNEDLYKLYRIWCLKNEYSPETQVHFTRMLKQVLPNLRVVPTRLKHYGDVMYKRVIRIDGFN